MSSAHGGEPVPLAAALDALRMAAMRAPGAGSTHAGNAEADSVDSDFVNADADAGAAAFPRLPAAHWPDGPGRVLERVDALDLPQATWDREAVFEAVREVAAAAQINYSRIRLLDDPADFPVDPEAFEDLFHDEGSGRPLRLGWVRQLGILSDRRNVRRLREWTRLHRRSADSGRVLDAYESRSPGHVLHVYAEARHWVEREGVLEGLILSPVSDLVEAYVGFMLDQGAAGWDQDWHPRDGVLEEFGVELQIGRLLSDAFCAGLGYLAVVDGEIAIARRPTLRVLDEPGVDGRPRFHYDSGPAIEFADGSGLYFLEGVNFPGWQHRAIVDGALTMRYVRDFSWQASRIAAYPYMPPAALLDGLDAQLLDVGRTDAMLYRVDDMPDNEGPVWYLVTTDPSTGREYGEFVPPEVAAHGSADAAQAAAWGISLEDYLRMTLED